MFMPYIRGNSRNQITSNRFVVRGITGLSVKDIQVTMPIS